ncbi:MAG: hypothetical protein Q8L97_12895 [Nitrosomonas sp.]|uniref:RCC1 domain-containing protein n=1 Tax=Nitrosomonas sp. TaxID=42353 RepID=UPI00272FA2C4|nr:hypothetical protein [Nitrosomonas sp.]MDP1551033.1 hypothetical protein [Nitrosomonas sp.]
MKHQIKQLTLFFCAMIFLGNFNFAAADTTSDTDTLLNWAENNYPTYFPTHQTTQSIAPWLFRFYPETNVYAGVNTNDNGVYVFGGPWGNTSPTYIDSLSNLLLVANNGKLTGVSSFINGTRKFVIKADGTVWGWGGNSSGALGDGTNIDRSSPVKVIDLTNVTQIVSGSSATIALKNDGTVWAWGSNSSGNLGIETTENQLVPTQIYGLSDDVIEIGHNGTINPSGFYAIKQDKTLWTWGCQDNKRIFTYLSCSPHLPTQVSGLSDVIDFQSSSSTTAAGLINSYYILKSDGTVWAWGDNFSGQLGDGSLHNTLLGRVGTNRDTPLQVAGLTGVKDIIPVVGTPNINVFAIKEDGTVWAWGDNVGERLGVGIKSSAVDKPTQVIGLTGIIKISAGSFNSLALKNDGTVWAWGWNNLYGAMGTGTAMITPIPTPVQLEGLSNIVDIQVGTYTSYAVEGDGTIWGWGSSLLKSGVEDKTYLTPIQICNLPGITNIFGNGFFSPPYLLKNDGTIWNAYFDGCTQL